MRNLGLFFLATILALGLSACTYKPADQTAPVEENSYLNQSNDQGISQYIDSIRVGLVNTGVVTSLLPENPATAELTAGITNQRFALVAEFQNLAPAPEGYSYVGWLVDDNSQSRVNLGKLKLIENRWFNVYQSPTDLSPYKIYEVTLEPSHQEEANDLSQGEVIMRGELS
jgi:hypothetical protein